MRVLDRLTAVVAALAFVLVGLGAPAHGETPNPGAVVTAAHRSIVHDAPSVRPPDGRPADVLVGWAEVMSCGRIDEKQARRVLDSKSLRSAWDKLQAVP